MQAARNFYHNNVMYNKYQKVNLKDIAEMKALKEKGLIADKVSKPKVVKPEENPDR